MNEMSPDEIARACAEAMWKEDRASQNLGMTLTHIAAGEATMEMTVTDVMTNGHGSAHGGYIFTLADSAFAFACNSYDQRCVAQHCAVTYIAPAAKGDRLTATAKETARFGRSGIYDIAVTRQDGSLIASFRGHSRTVPGRYLAQDEETTA